MVIDSILDGRMSVYDFIRVVGGQKGERKVWERICQQHPEYCDISAPEGSGMAGSPVSLERGGKPTRANLFAYSLSPMLIQS